MENWSLYIFALVFLGQIFLLSWFFPGRIVSRIETVLRDYPPETYPRLYPRSSEQYRLGKAVFRTATRLGLMLGLILLGVLLTWHTLEGGRVSEAWPVVFALVQFLPLLALGVMERSQFRLMRAATQTRRAPLQRRRVIDLVPPALLAAAALSFVAALAFPVLVTGHFEVDKAVALVGANLLMTAIGTWNFYRRKPDPLQNFEDWSRIQSATLRSVVYVTIAVNLFFVLKGAEDAFGLDALQATFMSLYFQAIGVLGMGTVLSSTKLEDIDFDVYRNGGSTA